MPVRISNLKLRPEEDEILLKQMALAVLHKKESELLSFSVVRRSVDARKKQVQLVYTVELSLSDESHLPKHRDVTLVAQKAAQPELKSRLKSRPIVVGTGPCGLFCALTLARAGAAPLILERGAKVEERARRVKSYWQGGALDENTNVQFGEGGAGTFSDGKLTTRISDPRSFRVLTDFHHFGADADILYKAKPHIGTDVLRRVIANIREYLISLGCEFRFETAMTGLNVKNGRVCGITTSHGEEIPCEHLVLAIGHSARDTYEMLFDSGVTMTQKPFSVGVRIEHLQREIDRAMYGDYAGHPKLGAADYQLSYKEGEDACYSFCMCPGGVVVAAASEKDTIVTNGMSYRARGEENANAALCVNVGQTDFGSEHPLAGVAFQRDLERRAFQMTGGAAPVQTVGSFLSGKPMDFGRVSPSYTGKTAVADFHGLFSQRICGMLSRGIQNFERKISGFSAPDSLLTGPETRTSAPVRIVRNENYESLSHKGLYPAGEGAGYAGGIMSAAVDGIRVAEGILTKDEE